MITDLSATADDGTAPEAGPGNLPASPAPALGATSMDAALLGQQLARFSADLHQVLHERNQARDALRRARVDCLLRLAAAAEFKDNDTGAHVMRMGHFSALIAAALDQPADYCENLLYASRMHDIGKIGIPDHILRKPGKLTEEEWGVMRKHPEIGATLLKDADDELFRLSAEIALTHHEKYDGTGYPHGLRRERIPLAGRIVAVADFFDALTMDRCYRPAMSDAQALALLEQGTGSHFDPGVVAAFMRILARILETRERINQQTGG